MRSVLATAQLWGGEVRKIHESVKIMPTALIGENVELGENCYIGAGAIIGTVPEHRDYFLGGKKFAGVRIGNGVFIGDGVTIHAGTTSDTLIGNNCTILCHSHVGHDAFLEDDVDVSPNAMIGGHAVLMRGSVLGVS